MEIVTEFYIWMNTRVNLSKKKGYDEVTSCDLTKRIQNHKEYSIHVVINQSIT